VNRSIVGALDGRPTLSHIVVCGGTTGEWMETTPEQWGSLIDVLARAVDGSGTRWVTLVPYSGDVAPRDSRELRERIVLGAHGSIVGERVTIVASGGVVFAVDPRGDGRQRFVDAVASLPGDAPLDEARVAATLLTPAPVDPDLVVVFGPPTRLPPSLVWELAYGEIVFFDTSWRACDVEHLYMAIDDFQRRERRFGGVDS